MNVHVGDVVKTPQGRIPWTVTKIRGDVASLRSANGSANRYFTKKLRVIECGHDEEPVDETVPVLRFEDDGTVWLGDKVIRGSDRLSVAVVEWDAPVMSNADPNEPSAVSVSRNTDREGRVWLWVEATGVGDFGASAHEAVGTRTRRQGSRTRRGDEGVKRAELPHVEPTPHARVPRASIQ